MIRPFVLAENNWQYIKDSHFDLAILPWGATEAHNYHLPYATDVIEATAVATAAAGIAWEKGAKVIVLPTIPFGVNTGQADIKLIINLNPSTQAAILADIIGVLERSNIKRLLILNSHGGNDFKQIIRELGLQHPSIFLCTCNWYQALDKYAYFEHAGDHADEMETSVIMHLTPQWVLPLATAGDGKEKKNKVKAFREGWAWAERKWSQVTEDTGIGYPKAATAAKGEHFFNDIIQKVASFLIELSAADPSNLYE